MSAAEAGVRERVLAAVTEALALTGATVRDTLTLGLGHLPERVEVVTADGREHALRVSVDAEQSLVRLSTTTRGDRTSRLDEREVRLHVTDLVRGLEVHGSSSLPVGNDVVRDLEAAFAAARAAGVLDVSGPAGVSRRLTEDLVTRLRAAGLTRSEVNGVQATVMLAESRLGGAAAVAVLLRDLASGVPLEWAVRHAYPPGGPS